ncbi:TIGR02569 family protein [Corynebacterium bovis]|uniref:TIGR02569 family protein n=3 Tax=Corynebacterium bovis TaxID=36808 RepID=A0A3R8PE01_9CORY|nr:TIGR02569 family protein [Corynebacterium bovis]WJY77114.1 hypothetical protein CBOVI_02880 [Corynebacterium bovis DSM 20582 = CIP 54.80]RRO80625.1 TIGR02569 family protein [Corynebacterium bovis]RRO82333.1 TIGR02569 family protein [Corynebacterium bovis]RRO82884.1 TIGR02569 family protein [Corynebacterium bovis]
MGMTAPPLHILSGFQVGHATPVELDDAWAGGWRCDRAVLRWTDDPARATWTAKTLDRVRPAGVAVARPIRSSDGRWSVGGWNARTFLSGARAPRFDETAATVLRVNEALRDEERPAFLTAPEPGRTWSERDILAAAEHAAWSPDPAAVVGAVLDPDSVPRDDVAQAIEKVVGLVLLRDEVTAPDQLVHADALGTTAYDGAADPVVTDIVPAWRPAGWSVAVLIVDSLAWANAEDTLLNRWSHLPDFPQLVLRAVIYRLFVHVLHPGSRPEAWPGLARVSDVVAARFR